MVGTSDFGVCSTLGDGMAAFIAASIAFDATEGVSIDDFEVKSLVLPLFGVSTLGVGVFLGEVSTSFDLLWISAESLGYSHRKDLSPTVNIA